MKRKGHAWPAASEPANLLIMPDSGTSSITALMGAVHTSLWIKMFTFDSPPLLEGVLDAHRRGLDVRVMLNPARSSGTRANDETMERLHQAGITAQWTNPAFAVTHEKSMIADERLLLATFNFSSKYLTATRDYGLVIDTPWIVAEARACFEADWKHERFVPTVDSPLAFSNLNAREATASVIDSAGHTLHIQHPKLSDMLVLDRLLAARERGVHVRFLCGGHHGISDSDKLDTYSAFRTLVRAGVHLRRQHGLRLHAKLLLADGERGMTGSMNLDRSAYDLRREMGIVFNNLELVHRLEQQFHRDWTEAKPYEAPDPLDSEEPSAALDTEGEHGLDPDLAHE